jgi:GT2 family glycosyltransferase
MDASIIIVNYRTEDLTVACINSIHKETKKILFEIIIVDNNPHVDNSSLFSELSPNIIYYKSELNVGFGIANNIGMQMARGEFLLLLNSDTIVIDNAIEKSINFLKTQMPSARVLGCKLLDIDRNYQPSFYPFRKWEFLYLCICNNPLMSKLFQIKKRFREPKTPLLVGDISGAYMLLHKSVFKESKGFDPDFFLYYEESEWCRNRIKNFSDIIYYPGASIIHIGGQSSISEKYLLQNLLSEGLFWYKKGKLEYKQFLVFYKLNSLFHLLISKFQRGRKREISKKTYSNIQHAFKFWKTDIPRYPSSFSSRPKPLNYFEKEI